MPFPKILSTSEINEFDNVPIFNSYDRKVFFNIPIIAFDNEIKKQVTYEKRNIVKKKFKLKDILLKLLFFLLIHFNKLYFI